MTRFTRAKLRTYVTSTAVAAGVVFFLGTLLLAMAGGGHALLAMMLPWVIFALAVGGLALAILLMPAFGAGPLARSTLAIVVLPVSIWVFTGHPGATVRRVVDPFGPLEDIWGAIGSWLSASGLGLLDSVRWRISLVGGLAVLAGYLVLRLTLAPALSAVGGLFRRVLRQWHGVGADDEADLPPPPGLDAFFVNLGARHFMLFMSTVMVGFVVLMPPALLALDASGLYGSGSHAVEAGEHVAWAGSLVLVLELTALALRDVLHPPRPDPAEAEPRTSRPLPRVEELFRRLQQLAGEFVVYAHPSNAEAPSAPRVAPSSDGSRRGSAAYRGDGPSASVVEGLARVSDLSPIKIEQVARVLDQFLDPRTQATSIALMEGLTTTHYELFALLVTHALDDGGTALVVAPDELVADVLARFDAALAACGLSFAVSILEATVNPPPEDELFNVVVVGESLFEVAFLRHADNFEGMLGRLSIILLLEVVDMDLGWLRLRLFSLWQLIDYERTRVVVQSSSSHHLDDVVSLVARRGAKRLHQSLSLTPSSRRATHVLVFDDCEKLRDDLQRKVFTGLPQALPAALFLAFESSRFDCEPILHRASLDPLDATRVKSGWSDSVNILTRNDKVLAGLENAGRALVGLSGDRFRPQPGPFDEPATVIGWDTANFLSMQERNYNFFEAESFLVQILSKNYPMREFLRGFEQLDGPNKATQRRIFLPQVPRLAGGVTELLYLVTRAMLRKQGLTRTQFKHMLETIPAGRFVERAGIGNDRSGIDVLLRLFGASARVFEEVEPLTGEKIFHLETVGGAWDVFDPIRVTQGGETVEDPRLDYNDRGLTYGVDTQVRVNDEIWQVAKIEQSEITLQGFNASKPLSSVVFVNRYAFKSDVDPIVEVDRSYSDAKRGIQVGAAVLHLSYRRHTEAMYEYPDGVEPLAPATPLLRVNIGNEPWTVVERNRKSVAHIVVNGLSNFMPVGGRIMSEMHDDPRKVVPEQFREVVPTHLRNAAVALAVCTIVKDTIASLFPNVAPRIAVLSTQLEQIEQRLEAMRSGGSSETAGTRSNGSLPDPLQTDIDLALFLQARSGCYDGGCSSLLDAWASNDLRNKMANRDDILELFVVEDSDRDLGVARALAQSEDVWRAAALFAASLADEERGPTGKGNYLRFGAPRSSRFVYVPGARDVLFVLGRVMAPPERGST